ncbi:MAG: pentapeptide repeat-containing protein [Chitinophagales bacterium]|nr:pentapeptide repeat-containing protein [Chitinophagales bacterium]
MDQFWKYSGIALWILIGIGILFALFYWNRWLVVKKYIGSNLVDSMQQLRAEIKAKNVQEETVTEVGTRIFMRFTKIGIFTLILAIIPIVLILIQTLLLRNQNDLLRSQNTLFKFQNERVDKQTSLIEQQTALLGSQDEKFGTQNQLLEDQNRYVNRQTGLLESQDWKLGQQNELFSRQNNMLDTQNYRLNLQNNLIEAERRGALIILMSNIMDQMNEEINEQKGTTRDSTGYVLSDPLIGRIAALSQGFLPYRSLEGDTLTEKATSPERGQLLLALVKSNLDLETYDEIYRTSDFSFANLHNSDLRNTYFHYINLHSADLRNADLRNTDFSGAGLRDADLCDADFSDASLHYIDLGNSDLHNTDFRNADLYFANFSGANLHSANLSNTNLYYADFNNANLFYTNLYSSDLSYANLNKVKNLVAIRCKKAWRMWECRNLDAILKKQLEEEMPCLFTEKGCEKNKSRWAK